ncbi:EGF family domain-containing protein [Besnoitia besnoiti]|uniref:EGF family domain-containing protein n=1 Tax=Besnoitia besnoiti TaxID=94643 RepID=A0A2A9M309_BESBE|nr:EGF family domain-containing protein [Besnoitia besnoiti]PFH31604.1 EGF family domain-containing protein [Besnoitia besnoiti]
MFSSPIFRLATWLAAGCCRGRGQLLLVVFTVLISVTAFSSLCPESKQGSCVTTASAQTASNARASYMDRFNIPRNHIDLVWHTRGSQSHVRDGIKYQWQERRRNVGVYTGYSEMYDTSSQKYCEGVQARIDTEQTVGARYMSAGACPNYGKVIAFTARNGSNPDMSRWKNEIHGDVMPHSTQGCARSGSPGDAEVPKATEGFAMYSGYMSQCPYNSNVYHRDMLEDGEYDPDVCSFVTHDNPLRFLDVTQPHGGLSYTPYAFHGNGGHMGYDYKGNTSHVGCPPYSPPRLTEPMKNSSWIRGPFDCSRLSRCTTHCWPYRGGSRCFRSLPAIYDFTTGECRLLGYHTQDFRKADCAESETNDVTAFYCVRSVKASSTSHLAYISSHTRPDYEVKCPPREPLRKVRWGILSGPTHCKPLIVVNTASNVTAEQCGQKLFEESSSDDPYTSSQVRGYHWATFISTDCPDMSRGCAATAKGTCEFHAQVPECFIISPESISFTSLTAVDPTLGIDPDTSAVLPEDKCVAVKCSHGRCDKTTGQCICDAGFEGPLCDKVDVCANNKCSGHGTCNSDTGACECEEGYSGDKCDRKDPCFENNCSGHGTCNSSDGKCVCDACYTGSSCVDRIEGCCAFEEDCGRNMTCVSGTCTCKEGWGGPQCSVKDLCAGVTCGANKTCDAVTGACVCKDICMGGPNCDTLSPTCCADNAVCTQPQGWCDMDQHKCVCRPGFAGNKCELKEDLCRGVTCLNGGACDPATGQCQCDACHAGIRCQIAKPHCCLAEGDCGAHGTCNPKTNACECKAGFAGIKCSSAEDKCKGKVCTTGYCDPATGACVCDACHTGASCEKKVEECCVTNQDCSYPNGTCAGNHKCKCQQGWSSPNCSTTVDKCKDVKCENGSVCQPETGVCMCLAGFGDEFCETCGVSGCKNGGKCQANGTCSCPKGFGGADCDGACPAAGGNCENGGSCDVAAGKCVCLEGFTGERCEEAAGLYSCAEWCKHPRLLAEAECSPPQDCPSVCCDVMKQCAKHHKADAPQAEWQECFEQGMDGREAGCCYAKVELGSNLAIYLAVGGVVLLLLAGGMAYAMTRGKAATGDGSASVDFGVEEGGAGQEVGDEEAIEVDLDDFKSHPDDEVDLGTDGKRKLPLGGQGDGRDTALVDKQSA